ncbi:hypothetical protein GW17_00039126, partial [Ensete ventricosum]
EESSGDLEVIGVIGIAAASSLLEIGEVLELRSEVEDVEHHRRGGAEECELRVSFRIRGEEEEDGGVR